jgi:hypothetical protein
VPNLAAVGITPHATPRAQPQPRAKAFTSDGPTDLRQPAPAEDVGTSGEISAPQLRDLIRSNAKAVLNGRRPYGSDPDDRSSQLAGFLHELHGCMNFLEAEGLPYAGTVDELASMAVTALGIEAKADRVAATIDASSCTWGDRVKGLARYRKLAAGGLAPVEVVGTEVGCLQPQGGRDLDRIRMAADQVAAENLNWSRGQYVHRLREVVEADLSVTARDDLYRREIGEAIIRRDGIESRPFIGGCELPDDTEEWIIEALILAGALNIIGADPKAGKTLLSVALIANLLHGCQQFIGCDITGRPPTVVIVGPDQPVRLWKKQLKAVGLVQGNILDPRIVQLWDSQNPWAATTEGIAELRQLCANHPGSLVLFDSFAKVSEKLGIDENSREAAEVLSDIERACIVSRCTPLVIHHNGKSAGRAGIVNGGALRGSGAIRANASQVAVLTLIDQDNPKDPRRRLVTEGRGGEFIDAVIQLEEDGWSWRHVCDYSEHRAAASVQRTREKLSPGQQAALDTVEASRDPLTTAQVWAVLHPEAPWAKDSSEAKNLSRTLSGLAQKNLLDRFQGIANRPTFARKDGRPKGVTTQGPRVSGVTPVTPCPLLEG